VVMFAGGLRYTPRAAHRHSSFPPDGLVRHIEEEPFITSDIACSDPVWRDLADILHTRQRVESQRGLVEDRLF
jgi:hypothetical protein